MTLSSLSFVVFVDPFQGNDGVLPFLFHSKYVVFLEYGRVESCLLSLTLELLGLYGAKGISRM
jgi:hypothetical protein